ncbi:unnamed protein product [Schistosoma intercalatum]|nr:unnamed protein product [Schistosoma intercalatum]
MSPLKWNYNLAAQAQKLAVNCTLQHNKRYSDEFSWVGQNIALGPTIKSGVDAWFNEHKLYDYNHNNCMECMHYTQMAWAKTTDIGCGVASCPKNGLSIVCNYGPGGNWNNEKPYEVKSRELCPKMQNIPKGSFQKTHDNTQRARLSIVNVNQKLSTTGSSGSRVHDQRIQGQPTSINSFEYRQRNTQHSINCLLSIHLRDKMNILLLLLLLIYIKVNIVFSQPNDPQLQKLLQYHNDLRRNLTECKFEGQPPAKYLPDLKWDNELASKAKDLANECYFHHNDVNLPHKWEYVGQNIAGYQTVEQAFDAWKDEYKQYSYYSMSCYGVCGHYTQLVWQNTTHVGCGITNCTGNYGFPYGLSVVCNYGPGGNYEGRYPYEAKSQDECYAVTTRRPKPTRRPVTTKRPRTTRRPITTKRPRTTRRPETTRRPITTKRPETIPTRKPGISKQIPKPNWPTLISSWSGFANSNMLQGIITKTCICIQ